MKEMIALCKHELFVHTGDGFMRGFFLPGLDILTSLSTRTFLALFDFKVFLAQKNDVTTLTIGIFGAHKYDVKT